MENYYQDSLKGKLSTKNDKINVQFLFVFVHKYD